METVLKLENLTKKFSKKVAVSQLNMTIKEGDIYGFIGKNGAGKTTVMKMIVGLSAPGEGEIELFGSSDLRSGRRRIGSIIESPSFVPSMTAKQNMFVQWHMLGLRDKSVIDDNLRLMGLHDVGHKKVKNFSLGMKQRLGLAMALLGEPDFLVVDEPTNGLDPEGIIEIRNILKKLNKECGLTILISSHILSELSKLSTRYGIINNGQIIDEFTEAELMERCRESVVIKVDNVDTACEVLKANLNNGEIVNALNENTIEVLGFNDSPGSINNMLAKNNVIVESLTRKSIDLEDYFMRAIGGGKDD